MSIEWKPQSLVASLLVGAGAVVVPSFAGAQQKDEGAARAAEQESPASSPAPGGAAPASPSTGGPAAAPPAYPYGYPYGHPYGQQYGQQYPYYYPPYPQPGAPQSPGQMQGQSPGQFQGQQQGQSPVPGQAPAYNPQAPYYYPPPGYAPPPAGASAPAGAPGYAAPGNPGANPPAGSGGYWYGYPYYPYGYPGYGYPQPQPQMMDPNRAAAGPGGAGAVGASPASEASLDRAPGTPLMPYGPAPSPGGGVGTVVPAPARLELTTASEEARAAALGCLGAIEHERRGKARRLCGEAVAKDPTLAVAHLWLAQVAATPEQRQIALHAASEHAVRASAGERHLVAGWRAAQEKRSQEARRHFDSLVARLDGEPRAFTARGRFRMEVLGDLDGAVEDFNKAVSLDDKHAPAQHLLGLVFAQQGKLEFAHAALKAYADLAPSEPNPRRALADLALARGDVGEALVQARRALALDAKFLPARRALGDALVFANRRGEARREYAQLEASDDPGMRRDGALRGAFSHLVEEKHVEGERLLVRAADAARRDGRSADAAEIFLMAARSQLERGALPEAGRGVREALASLGLSPMGTAAVGATVEAGPTAAPVLSSEQLRTLRRASLELRALSLGAIGERALAEGRVDELLAEARQSTAGPRAVRSDAEVRAAQLKGWIAARAGDEKAAITALEGAEAPLLRLALAQALLKAGEAQRARAVAEPLAKRTQADLESALARPRAIAMLKALPASPASPFPPSASAAE